MPPKRKFVSLAQVVSPSKPKPISTLGQLTKAPGVNSPGKVVPPPKRLPASEVNKVHQQYMQRMREQNKPKPPKPKGKGPWVWSNLNHRWTHPWCK